MEFLEGVVSVVTEERGDSATSEGQFADVEAFVDAVAAIGTAYDTTLQAFDARYVVSRRHLEAALRLADRERAHGDAIARDRAVEWLLYTAGRRQIDRALEMGVGEGKTPVVVAVDGTAESAATAAAEDLLSPADTLGEFDVSRVRSFFDIGEAELAATSADLESLVLERVALLVVDR